EVSVSLVAQIESVQAAHHRMVGIVEPDLHFAIRGMTGTSPAPDAAKYVLPRRPVVEAYDRRVQGEQTAAAREVGFDRGSSIGGQRERPARAMRRVFVADRHAPSQRVNGEE